MVTEEKGTLSIHTENIFPIIKKFLYSDHEIFLRELVSNAVDATQKLNRLAALGEYKGKIGDTKIKVSIDEKAKTITISDKGIGLTTDEIKKYINQIAFSGAAEFVEKYKDKGEEKQIIGHFGLGFYSSYMVAKKVEIFTKSYQTGAEAARWECDGSTDFEITPTKKKDRGTDIVLHIAEDSEEFLQKHRLQGILDKYCKFLPIEIEFDDKVVNNPSPIWTKQPSELKDEDYLNFYKELYPFAEDPLFWIHLNVDYPFNLTGVLYFPKLKNELDVQRNKIQLYSRQVFITDEVKDVVPEFLMLLHGVIDSPDIPLNVSRSYLQSDGNVKKINTYITKKVADKLGDLFKKDRAGYEKKWNDIGLFVKYGMISEEKFYEKALDYTLVQDIDDKFYTLKEYEEHVKPNQTDKDGNAIFLYTTKQAQQHSYIENARKREYGVLKMDGQLDNHFINHMEMKMEKVNWKRVDADVLDKLIDKDEKKESVLSEKEQTEVKELFDKAINNKAFTVNVEAMSTDDMPVVITLPEFMRRMKDMSAMGGGMAMMGNMPDAYSVAINGNHALVGKILKAASDEEKTALAKQAFDLAKLSQNLLTGPELTAFIKRSLDIVSA
ncbi:MULTISPECIES: molecular chaperone HtpG [unclassified Imperialibacter]|uniref:molecular chaperone HtpG n=1 Tax=unclassified Imperialibacter TaxID=2629706 RepID=UPI00125EE012|nr:MULTISPECIES: molecular chaperone HtpG [unclassified Imperialibacter]